MLEPLLGLPGRIKILIDRITSTRASNLDNLNATVSSRAPASTALSSSVWTGTRAGYLDASISGRASQSSVDAIPASPIKSVQRGLLIIGYGYTPPHNVTISSVDLGKSMLTFSYGGAANDALTPEQMFWGRLTSSTNIRFDRYQTSSSSYYTIEWEVVEYV